MKILKSGELHEKLNIRPVDLNNIKPTNIKYFPETKDELVDIIKDRMEKEGDECDLNDIDISKITDLSGVFSHSEFNGDVSKWDTSNVMNMQDLFFNNAAFNGDISKWDVSRVTNMYSTFEKAKKFNGDISKWDVSHVTNMRDMFADAIEFNCDISKWNTSSATDMGYMFAGAKSFEQDLSGWDVSKVTDWNCIFNYLCPLKKHPERQPDFNI